MSEASPANLQDRYYEALTPSYRKKFAVVDSSSKMVRVCDDCYEVLINKKRGEFTPLAKQQSGKAVTSVRQLQTPRTEAASSTLLPMSDPLAGASSRPNHAQVSQLALQSEFDQVLLHHPLEGSSLTATSLQAAEDEERGSFVRAPRRVGPGSRYM